MTGPRNDLAAALRSIPGVADAEIDDAADDFEGVRVRLEGDADAAAVSEAVQRLLAAQGLRTRMAPPRGPMEPEAPPPPPEPSGATVLPGPGWVEPDPEPPPKPTAGQVLLPLEPEPPVQAPGGVRRLSRLHVEEGRDVVTVTAFSTDGQAVVRTARPSQDAMEQAVVAAVGALCDPGNPTPTLIEIEDRRLGNRLVITVVLSGSDGRHMVGSADLGAERSFALARAVWAAMTERL